MAPGITGFTVDTVGVAPPATTGLTVGGVVPTGTTGRTAGGAVGGATVPIGTTGFTTGMIGTGAGVFAASPGLGRLSIEIDCVRRGGATGSFPAGSAEAAPGLAGSICAVPVLEVGGAGG